MNINKYNNYLYPFIDNDGFVLLEYNSRKLFIGTAWSYIIIPSSSNMKYIFSNHLKYVIPPIMVLLRIIGNKITNGK